MSSRIIQALLTYWRWITAGWANCGAFFLMMLACIVFSFVPGRSPEEVAPFVVFLGLIMAISYHLKHQVTLIRLRRMPHALGPHLIVGTTLILIATFFWPLARLIQGVPVPIAQFAIVTVGAAFAIWLVAKDHWFLICLAVLIHTIIRSTGAADLQKWFAQFLQGGHEGAGVAMLACGLGGMALAILRLARLSEGDAGYMLRLSMQGADLYQRDPARSNNEAQRAIWRNQSKWFSWTDARTPRISLWPTWARGTLRQRIKLRLAPRANQTITPVLTIISMLLTWRLVSSDSARDALQENLVFSMQIGATTILIVILMNWHQQWAILSTELLRPASRRQYIAELGLAIYKQVALAWFWVCVLLLALQWYISTDPAHFEKTVKIVVLSSGVCGLLMGVFVWLMRYRSRMVTFLIALMMMLGFAISIPASIPDWSTLRWLVPVMMAAAAGVAYDAYRRWLQVELG